MKRSLVIAVCAISFISNAQNSSKKLDFGFNLGTNYGIIDISPDYANIQENLGFNLGVEANYNLHKHFSLLGDVSLFFNKSVIVYSPETTNEFKQSPVGTSINGQIMGKIHPIAHGKLYIGIGTEGSLALDKKPENTTMFPPSNGLWANFSIGFDQPTKNFNFCPEITYSYGINNVNPTSLFQNVKYHKIGVKFRFRG